MSTENITAFYQKAGADAALAGVAGGFFSHGVPIKPKYGNSSKNEAL